MTNPIHGLTILILERLIDADMDNKKKTLVRNLLPPFLEYIEDAENPEDAIKRANILIAIASIPIALAIHSSLKPEAYNSHILAMTDKQYSLIQEIVSMLVESFDKNLKGAPKQ